jgi:hypothetical protein
MTDSTIQFEGGEVLANLDDRTITGLLIPYGEEGRTNIGRFQVEAGTVELPTDPAVISLNIEHVPQDVVGRATKIWETDHGVMAMFRVANTPAGDAALADAKSMRGRRRRLSAEFGPAVIKAGKLVAGHAKVWGSALVEAGAFPSAQVLAADTPDDEVEETPEETPTAEAVENPDAATAEDNEQEEESNVTTTEVAAVAQPAATIPATLRTTDAAQVEARAVDSRQVLAAISDYKANPGDAAAMQVLAALTDIKLTGSGSLPGSTSLLQPAWLGALYQGVPYVREYITLGNLGTNIAAGGKKGFKISRGTSGTPIEGPDGIPNGGTWAGNKAEINSYNGFTTALTSTLRRFAVGHDIAREFFDLPGGAEFVEAFLQLVLEDHLYWSDTSALADIVTAAGTPVAPATYPADYPDAMGMLIQGILAVKARKADGRRDVPTFAIANELAFAELLYAAGGPENLPEFVSIAVSTNSNGTADGNVQVVQGDIGVEDTAAVIVGAKKAIEFDELPGGPLVVDALEVAKGGIDRAVHGYLQTFVVRPEAIKLIGVADTP